MDDGKKSIQLAIALFLLLEIASGFLLLFRLGSTPLIDYDEAIYAQVIQDTQHVGDFLTLRKGDVAWFEKPPLYMWLAMGSEKILGPNEFALRFPSAVLGLLAIALTCLIALEISESAYVAVFAGAVLLTSGGFLEAARQLRLDIPVTTAILFALYSFFRARRNEKWYIGIGIGIGVGILFKSIIGLLAIPILLIWSVFEGSWGWLKNKYLWYGMAAALLLLLPWHLFEAYKYGSAFWNEYLFHQVFQRFSADVNGGSVTDLGYVKYIFLNAIPWVIVFVLGGVWNLAFRFRSRSAVWINGTFVSVLFIFGLFMISHTKIVYYLIPLFPLVAIFCALFAQQLYRAFKSVVQRNLVLVSIIFLLVGGFANTIYIGFNFQKELAANTLFAHDEYQIALYLKSHPEVQNVSAFRYLYWDTITYYSGRKIAILQVNEEISKPLYVITYTYPYQAGWFRGLFPDAVLQHFKPVYSGESVTLLEYQP